MTQESLTLFLHRMPVDERRTVVIKGKRYVVIPLKKVAWSNKLVYNA